MLRPATPLSVLYFAAFGLLLISVLSTPIVKQIPLGTFQGVNFGVFGYCKGDDCSKIEIGYDTSRVLNDNNESDFDLPSSARATLSAILIVHPVAALLTLITLILAIVSHLHSPSHSSRYLLLVFILSIIDLLVCLLAFLIDVLLFVPHMAFGSYLVLAATILVALSGIVSCAMRRTLVSRKARKKRIAENAEMSGENYYNREAQKTTMPVNMQPTMPVVSGANGTSDNKVPVYATFSDKKDDRSSDERIPLTQRSPSDRSPNNMPNEVSPVDAMYNGPAGPRRAPSRDQFGNPINAPPDAYGMRRPSNDSQRSRGRAVPPGGYRGRGGVGPRGGGYGPYGPGRGGYGPPGRGGYGPPGGRGGYGPPPRGYGGGPVMRGGRPPGPPPPGYNSLPYDRRGSPAGDGYGGPSGPYGGRGPSSGPPSAPGYAMNNMNPSMPSVATGGSYEAYNPDRDSELPRAESPPPLPGTETADRPSPAAGMHATAGSPSHPPENFGQFRDSDADIVGMVGLQQGRPPSAQRHDTYMSEASRYSQADDVYVPARANWNPGPGRSSPALVPSPLRPGAGSPRATTASPPAQPPVAADNYYEDVDPRFAEPAAPSPALNRSTPPALHTENSYEDIRSIPDGARSPAESERSNFTSISQRGVNPRWNPPPQMAPYGGVPPRRPVQRKDVLLDNNPDFQLPAARGTPGSQRYPAGL